MLGGFATQATAWAFNGGFQWEVRNRQSPSVLISDGTLEDIEHSLNDLTYHMMAGRQNNLETMWALMPRYGINFLAKGDALWDLQMGYNEELLDGDLGLEIYSASLLDIGLDCWMESSSILGCLFATRNVRTLVRSKVVGRRSFEHRYQHSSKKIAS